MIIYKLQLKMVKKLKTSLQNISFIFFNIIELIKFVVALQQQYSSKLAQMDETHSKALKELEIQLIQQRNTVDRESSSN